MELKKIEITDFEKKLQTATKPILGIFFATWCPYCQENVPEVQAYLESSKLKGDAYLIQVENEMDVWAQDGEKKWALEVVPTYRIYDKNKLVWDQSGPVKPEKLVKALQNRFTK
ncbi:thioredoxin family protein [[Mycoplasma] testudinis]|uniref:thioredoxin family protein n=1 Tax=[Mycoplasma] testudinis TaxID=33924 RepID=UPI000487BBCA|nr:thioredoxin family protein [[Mycoplasma] testudinis]